MPSTVRSTTIGRQGFIYLPLGDTFYPEWEIKITDQDGTVHTISDLSDGTSANNYLLSSSVVKGTTEKLGSAVLRFINPPDETTGIGKFTDKFTGGEIVDIKARYQGESYTRIFRGKVDNPKNGYSAEEGFFIEVDVRDYPEMTDTVITGSSVGALADVVIYDVLTESGFSDISLQFWDGNTWTEGTFDEDERTVSWEESTGSAEYGTAKYGEDFYAGPISGDPSTFPTTGLTFSWQDKKPLSVIAEACKRSGLDFYLHYDDNTTEWKLRTFVTDAKKNDAVNASFGNNIISLGELGPENTDIRNKVTVYGRQESDNIIILATEEDTDSQSDLWIKQKIIKDSSLTKNSEVRARAEFELSEGLVSGNTGSIVIVGEEDIFPGEQISVSIPQLGISDYYTVREVTHNIGLDGFTTSLSIKRLVNRFDSLFKEKIDIEKEAEAAKNLNNMTDSFNIYFDESPSKIASHSNTQELEGKLVLESGQTTGLATSVTHSADFSIGSCELRKYSNFPIDEDDVYEVSNDNGVTWETYDISSGETHTFTSTGSSLKVRITLNRDSVNDVSPAYESVVLLYKGT